MISLGEDESPDSTLIDLLKAQIIVNAEALRQEMPTGLPERIRDDIAQFQLDLQAVYDEIKGPQLDCRGAQGTHFFILPADRIIESDMDDAKDSVASSLTKAPAGFLQHNGTRRPQAAYSSVVQGPSA